MKANSEKKIPGPEKVIHPLKRTGQWMRRIGIYSLILVCFLVSCENVQDVVMRPLTTDETHGAGESGDYLNKVYYGAVVDAAKAEPSEISTHLLAIVKDDQINLTWSEDKKEVLMATWIPERFLGTYQQNGQPIDKVKIGFGEVWVTAVPELKKFCREHRFASKKDLELRLEQLLGLPPNSRTNPQNKKEYFVEMWVKPDDLFRPCPDSEIDDHQCELGEAEGDFEVRDGKPFVEWFTDAQKADYPQSNPDMMNAWFPWTRLGYTYDWGNPVNEVGLSEFVIKSSKSQDIRVKVKSVMRTADYCMVP